MKKNQFKKIYEICNLSHHNFNVSFNYLEWLFKDIDFKGKSVLDIGGGRGLYSYYAKFKGASNVTNLDPFSDGSSGMFIDSPDLFVMHESIFFQDLNPLIKFDIIILHDSINHLNEPMYSNLHSDEMAYNIYSLLLNKMYNHLNINGLISVSDCSSFNFYNYLGLKNPFSPTIEWHLHQPPKVLIEIFKKENFKFLKLRWSPFKRFGVIGRLLSGLGFIPSFFMQSHYNILFKK